MATKFWPFRPDWAAGVLEKLEWFTDLMASTKGAEQRRPQRLTPRKTLEVTFLPHFRTRSVFDLYVTEHGNDDWLIPLWYDNSLTTSALAAHDTVTDIKFVRREFTIGGLAVLRPAPTADVERTNFVYEIVRITGVTDRGTEEDTIIIQRGQEGTLPQAWPAGSELYPVRLAHMASQPSASVVSASIVSTNMAFLITEPNEFIGTLYSGYGMTYGLNYARRRDVTPITKSKDMGRVLTPQHLRSFEGFRVLTTAPDFNQDLSVTYERELTQMDNDSGIPAFLDGLGFGSTTQKHTWFLNGARDVADFRALLYWLRGRVRPIWVPTFNDDVQLIAPVEVTDQHMDIQDIYYSKSGGGINRQVLAIQLHSGKWYFRRILAALSGTGFERLELSHGFPMRLAPEDIYKISFMAVCRLSQDGVEINHETDNQGLAKSVINFRATPDLRQYLPWTLPPFDTSAECVRACAGYPYVEDWTNTGLVKVTDSVAKASVAAEYAYVYYNLRYSQSFTFYDVVLESEGFEYFAWRLSQTTPGGDFAWGNFDEAAARIQYRATTAPYYNHSKTVMLAWITAALGSEIAEQVEDYSTDQLRPFYLVRRFATEYNGYMLAGAGVGFRRTRNWLPMQKLNIVQPTCPNNMLGRFCVESVYYRDPLSIYPTNFRGAQTIFAAGMVHNTKELDEDWPHDIATVAGQSYYFSQMPTSGSGLHSSCGCIPIMFLEEHVGMRPSDNPPGGEASWIQWWHRCQIAILTPAAWPANIRFVLRDSFTGIKLRDIVLPIRNVPVTAKADHLHKLPEDADFSANLVIYRESFGLEAEGQTTIHPDPWQDIWKVVPLNSVGFVVEVFPA